MDLNGLFQSPARHIADFAEKQVHLYRHDPGLQDYFLPLQLDARDTAPVPVRERRLSSQIAAFAIHGIDNVSRFGRSRRVKADVLFCPMPYFDRKTENRLLVRTLLGLAQTDARIVCLLPAGVPCRDELIRSLEAAGRSGQVEFVDPTASLNPIEARTRSRVARLRGRSAFETATSILEPFGMRPSRETEVGFQHLAHFVEAWERLAPQIEFDAVVSRCHWHALCSPVCRTARERGKPVITFQQGVIGHTLDVPVTASKYVAFGQSSASFLAQMNRRFFQAVGVSEPPVDYVHGGCLYDTITPLPDQFDQQTLLIVDVPMAQDDFYGTESQCRALLELAEKLLTANVPLRRLVIRPHPFWSNLDFAECQRLIREHPTRCELSHPAWSLEDDLRRSSVVAGIFSGVLTVASACGLPTIFLETEHGYSTGDLACFSPHQTLLPDAAFCQLVKILTDQDVYKEARQEALQNAREYYKDSANLNLDGRFFSGLLRTGAATNQLQAEIK